MADCPEVVTRRNIVAMLQTALETTTLSAGINNVTTTIPLTEYPLLWPLSGNFSFVIGTETLICIAGQGTTSLTVTRAAPVSHSSGATVSIVTSRVYSGVKDLGVGSDFFGNLVSKGPAVQVRWSQRASQDYQGHFVYHVPIRMYYGYAKNADNTGYTVENINALIYKTLADTTNYTGSTKGNPPSTEGFSFPGLIEDVDDEVGVCVKYEVTVPFDGAQ